MKIVSVMNRLRRKMLTCFRFISSKLEPTGARGNNEEAEIMTSDVFG